MRRGRAPSREPSGSGGPQWDDPNGQLPGTGIPGDGRRRDASPVGGTVESVGQEGVGVVPERPSLFSTSGSSSFNPFSAALSSLRPEERESRNQPDGCFRCLAKVCEPRDAEVVCRTFEKLATRTYFIFF